MQYRIFGMDGLVPRRALKIHAAARRSRVPGSNIVSRRRAATPAATAGRSRRKSPAGYGLDQPVGRLCLAEALERLGVEQFGAASGVELDGAAQWRLSRGRSSPRRRKSQAPAPALGGAGGGRCARFCRRPGRRLATVRRPASVEASAAARQSTAAAGHISGLVPVDQRLRGSPAKWIKSSRARARRARPPAWCRARRRRSPAPVKLGDSNEGPPGFFEGAAKRNPGADPVSSRWGIDLAQMTTHDSQPGGFLAPSAKAAQVSALAAGVSGERPLPCSLVAERRFRFTSEGSRRHRRHGVARTSRPPARRPRDTAK